MYVCNCHSLEHNTPSCPVTVHTYEYVCWTSEACERRISWMDTEGEVLNSKKKNIFFFIYKESSNYWSLGFHFCPRCFCCWLKWRRGSAQQNLLIIYWRNTHFSAKMELVAHVFYKFMLCNLTSLVLRWMFPREAECISGAVLSAQLG